MRFFERIFYHSFPLCSAEHAPNGRNGPKLNWTRACFSFPRNTCTTVVVVPMTVLKAHGALVDFDQRGGPAVLLAATCLDGRVRCDATLGSSEAGPPNGVWYRVTNRWSSLNDFRNEQLHYGFRTRAWLTSR